MVECLGFIIAYPARSLFRSVDRMLPTAKGRMISATEASQRSYVGVGRLEVFSKNEVGWVSGGVERRGEGRSRAGTPNNGSVGSAVESDGWLVSGRAKFGFFVG